MTEARPVRIGIVGTGAVAQLVHIPICTERTDVEVVALADAERDKAEALAERFGVGRVQSTEDLVTSDDIDAVILSAPTWPPSEGRSMGVTWAPCTRAGRPG